MDPPHVDSLGAILRRRRDALRMSQADLAKAAGVDVRQVRRYETDDQYPVLPVAVRLAVALGVTMDELTSGLRPAASPGPVEIEDEGAPAQDDTVTRLERVIAQLQERVDTHERDLAELGEAFGQMLRRLDEEGVPLARPEGEQAEPEARRERRRVAGD
jgi:transcriptional regulator with XRE-family HTH domain